jgi:hypothetical protein
MRAHFIPDNQDNMIVISERVIPELSEVDFDHLRFSGLVLSQLGNNQDAGSMNYYSIPGQVVRYCRSTETMEDLVDFIKGDLDFEDLPEHVKLMLMIN